MQRCIELSQLATREGEFPFACVIARDGTIVTEATNRVMRDGDVTRHAELVAISQAQKALGTRDLSGCTLYTNVEPCVMCSFPIRETRISRVVYSIGSPLMGGDSRWDLLGDPEISNVMPEAFGEAPEVVRGFLRPRGREGVAQLESADLGRDPLSRLLRRAGEAGTDDRSGTAAPLVATKAFLAAPLRRRGSDQPVRDASP